MLNTAQSVENMGKTHYYFRDNAEIQANSLKTQQLI